MDLCDRAAAGSESGECTPACLGARAAAAIVAALAGPAPCADATNFEIAMR